MDHLKLLETLRVLASKVELSPDEVSVLKSIAMRVAFKDGMTGLHNRHFFELELSQLEPKSNPIAIVVMDIDHCIKINQEYGHDIGDEVIRHFSKVALEDIQKPDCLVRMGGEEFALLLKNKSFEQCVEIAEKIRKKAEEHPFYTEIHGIQREIRYTVSMGLCYVKEEQMTSRLNLMTLAEGLLYQSKRAGKNRVTSLSI